MKKSIVVVVAIACAIAPVLSNKPPKKQKGATPAPAAESATPGTDKPKDKAATIESKTKNCVKIDGLFPLYQDSTDGKLYLLVNAKQLNTEFIHFAYTENVAPYIAHPETPDPEWPSPPIHRRARREMPAPVVVAGLEHS